MGKRVGLWMLAAALCLTLAACGGSAGEKTPCQRGEDVAAMLSEMTESEAYLNAMSGSQAMKDKLLHIGTKTPDTPDLVYAVTLDEEALLQDMGFGGGEDLSAELEQTLRARVYGAVAAQINAAEGAEALAASSLCTASMAFASREITENALYLYIYDDGAPVLVSFTPNQEGIVSATGSFLMKDTADLSRQTVTAWFSGLSADLQPVAGR